MRAILHICAPEGETLRQTLTRLTNEVKLDNRRVIRALLSAGHPVADTVGELGLDYVPEQHEVDDDGEPIVQIYGMRPMLVRGTFSCGDASGYEAAVLEEKYGIPAHCVSTPQPDDITHGVIITRSRAIDPTANFLRGRVDVLHGLEDFGTVTPNSCRIEDGRVICDEPPACSVDPNGNWYCPEVPGLTGRREHIGPVLRSSVGAWTKTQYGVPIPVRTKP